MATFHGKTAKAFYGPASATQVGFLTDWGLEITSDVADTTVMGQDYKSSAVGFEGASATMAGNAATERDTIAQIGTSHILKLYIDATHYFTVTTFCTGITETASKDDVGKISYTFARNNAADIAYV